MNEKKFSNFMKVITALTFVAMITVNALANILPINGQGTGQVSDSYPNLFAPAGITFAIWGVIYLLLLCFTLYALGLFQKDKKAVKAGLLREIGILFSLSSIANAIWIFSWHYHQIPLSMLLMTAILVCLIRINRAIKKEILTKREKLFIQIPFSVYFGWITVATIANAIALLVSLGWNGFGIAEATWAIIIIAVGAAIGFAAIVKNRDIAYGLVLIWAYIGIWIKHTSASGFSGQYPAVITAVIACTLLFSAAEVVLVIKRIKR
jgi:hypothetical protein